MAIVYLIHALVIAIIAVIFAIQNPTGVTVTFFAWKASGSLSLVLLVTLVIGVLIGWLIAAPSLVKHTFRASGQRKRIGALEKELEDHKSKLSELQKPAPVVTPPAEKQPPQPPSASSLPPSTP